MRHAQATRVRVRFRLQGEQAILVVQDGRIAFANPSATEIIGYRHKQLLGLRFDDFIHPDDRWVVADGFSRRFAGEDVRGRFGYRILRQYGETRHLEANAVHIDWKGQPATLSFLADVTERRQAENALRGSEEQFRRAFEDSGVGKLLTGQDGSLQRVNRAFAGMLGYSVEELHFVARGVNIFVPCRPPTVWTEFPVWQVTLTACPIDPICGRH